MAFTLGLGEGELEFVDDGVLTTLSMNSSPSVGDDANAGASAAQIKDKILDKQNILLKCTWHDWWKGGIEAEI